MYIDTQKGNSGFSTILLNFWLRINPLNRFYSHILHSKTEKVLLRLPTTLI